jgi:hypothetical protein
MIDNKLTKALLSGLAGAAAPTVLHETVRRGASLGAAAGLGALVLAALMGWGAAPAPAHPRRPR